MQLEITVKLMNFRDFTAKSGTLQLTADRRCCQPAPLTGTTAPTARDKPARLMLFVGNVRGRILNLIFLISNFKFHILHLHVGGVSGFVYTVFSADAA